MNVFFVRAHGAQLLQELFDLFFQRAAALVVALAVGVHGKAALSRHRAAVAARFQLVVGALDGIGVDGKLRRQRAYNELETSGYCCSVPGKGCFAVHTYRAQDDARRLSLEHQLKELLQELRAMGVSEEDIQALCREGDAK